jgi:Flp pilus assembly protein TadG
MKTRFGKEEGTALVELALVLPLLMVLLLAMLDFGKAFNAWIDETHLANLGARLATVGYPAVISGTCDGSVDANPNICLTRYIQQGADIAELKSGRTGDAYAGAESAAQVCISYPTNPASNTFGKVGDPVKVTVQFTYQWFNYLIRRVSLASTPMSGTATMRLERQASAGALAPAGHKTCYP